MMKCEEIELEALLTIQNDQGDALLKHDPEVENHVGSCTRCQSRLSELAADTKQWNEMSQLLSSESITNLEPRELHAARERWKQPMAWTQAMAKSLLSAASHPELLGRIGRYDVEQLIGSGGMGVVFKAHDTELHRSVAIKLLAPYLASSGAARSRFAREARAAAAVVDDHVVPIHNVEMGDESSDQPPFLVMKYIAGSSLQQRLDREGPLDVCEVLRIGMHTAKGLAAAHAHGLIHRDVKPSNILLDEGVDRALLTDFGLARATDDASMTRSGFHPGTPHYMSPEQVRGETIDARSDLFGLGCVLYAMCTGHPPFRSESSYAVLRRITDDTPRPIRETNPRIPIWLEKIATKLMAKSPAERYDSAEQVAELLERCLAHVQQPTTNALPESLGRAATAGRRLRLPPYSTWIATTLFAFILFFAGVLLVLEWNHGTLTIVSEVEDIPIRIRRGDDVVERLTMTNSVKSVRIAAGNYVVEIDGDFPKVTVKDGNISLGKQEAALIMIQSTTPQSASTERGNPEANQIAVPHRSNRDQNSQPILLDPLLPEQNALWQSAIVDVVYHSFEDGQRVLGNGVVISPDGVLVTYINSDLTLDPHFDVSNILAHFDDGSEVPIVISGEPESGLVRFKPRKPIRVNHFFQPSNAVYRVGDSAWLCFRSLENNDDTFFFDRAKVMMTDRRLTSHPSPVWQLDYQQENRDRSGGMPLLTHDGELLAITLPPKRGIAMAIPIDQLRPLLEGKQAPDNNPPNSNIQSGD